MFLYHCSNCSCKTTVASSWVGESVQVSECVSFSTKTALCRLGCCAHVGALTSSGSLRCSVQTSSPRRSRFLRSALALLHTHTNMHISGKKQSEGRLKCTLHHLNLDLKPLCTELSHAHVQAHTDTHSHTLSLSYTPYRKCKCIYHGHPRAMCKNDIWKKWLFICII